MVFVGAFRVFLGVLWCFWVFLGKSMDPCYRCSTLYRSNEDLFNYNIAKQNFDMNTVDPVTLFGANVNLHMQCQRQFYFLV